RRPARRAAHQVRAGDQSQDRQGARRHRPADAARHRRRGDRMRRREFMTLVGGAAVAGPLGVHAQQTIRAWRIGYLETSSPSAARVRLFETLRQRLRELGYLEGQNIAFEARFAEGKTDRLSGLAAELVGLKVDGIFTSC